MHKSQQSVYIDVREPAEFAGGHVEGAINIPVGSIDEATTALNEIPKDSRIVVYCRSGGRAENAKAQLRHLGYTNVENGINQATIEKNHKEQ